jgi:hypothetical protein
VESFITLDSVCVPSQGVVAREIEGEIVIVPVVRGIGRGEDELYTLNETAQAIWQKLDGELTLKGVAEALADEFDTPLAELEVDVLGLVKELADRGILVPKT